MILLTLLSPLILLLLIVVGSLAFIYLVKFLDLMEAEIKVCLGLCKLRGVDPETVTKFGEYLGLVLMVLFLMLTRRFGE